MSITVTSTTLATIAAGSSYSKIPGKVEEMLILGTIAGIGTDTLTIKTYFDVEDTGGKVSAITRLKQPTMARNASNEIVDDLDNTIDANGLFNFMVTFPKNANKIYFDLDQGGGSDPIVITLDAITHGYSI